MQITLHESLIDASWDMLESPMTRDGSWREKNPKNISYSYNNNTKLQYKKIPLCKIMVFSHKRAKVLAAMIHVLL